MTVSMCRTEKTNVLFAVRTKTTPDFMSCLLFTELISLMILRVIEVMISFSCVLLVMKRLVENKNRLKDS